MGQLKIFHPKMWILSFILDFSEHRIRVAKRFEYWIEAFILSAQVFSRPLSSSSKQEGASCFLFYVEWMVSNRLVQLPGALMQCLSLSPRKCPHGVRMPIFRDKVSSGCAHVGHISQQLITFPNIAWCQQANRRVLNYLLSIKLPSLSHASADRPNDVFACLKNGTFHSILQHVVIP